MFFLPSILSSVRLTFLCHLVRSVIQYACLYGCLFDHTCLSLHLPTILFICLSAYLYLSIHFSIYSTIFLYLSICLLISISLSLSPKMAFTIENIMTYLKAVLNISSDENYSELERNGGHGESHSLSRWVLMSSLQGQSRVSEACRVGQGHRKPTTDKGTEILQSQKIAEAFEVRQEYREPADSNENIESLQSHLSTGNLAKSNESIGSLQGETRTFVSGVRGLRCLLPPLVTLLWL